MILVSSSLKMFTKIFLSLLSQNILKNLRVILFIDIILIANWHYFFRVWCLSHPFLKRGTVNVDKTNAIDGTKAFINGFGSFATKKNRTTTQYVRTKIMSLRVRLVSHALSASTRLFRVLISSISFLSSSRVVIKMRGEGKRTSLRFVRVKVFPTPPPQKSMWRCRESLRGFHFRHTQDRRGLRVRVCRPRACLGLLHPSLR